MPLFGRKDKKEKKKPPPGLPGRKQPSPSPTPVDQVLRVDRNVKRHSASFETTLEGENAAFPHPSASMQDLKGASAGPPMRFTALDAKSSSLPRDSSGAGGNVSQRRAFFEAKASSNSMERDRGNYSPSPEKRRESTTSERRRIDSSSTVVPGLSVFSPTDKRSPLASSSPLRNFQRSVSGPADSSPALSRQSDRTDSTLSLGLESALELISSEVGKEKEFEGVDLVLPPLQTTTVQHRSVVAVKNPRGGGFGFMLRKSYLPVPEDPEKTTLVHLIEPRSDYDGPLMTGDRIIEVNGIQVADAAHERVVEMIKDSGDVVEFLVASMPELLELNNRGALDDPFKPRNSNLRKSGRSKMSKQPTTGTLRRKAAATRKAFKVRGHTVKGGTMKIDLKFAQTLSIAIVIQFTKKLTQDVLRQKTVSEGY